MPSSATSFSQSNISSSDSLLIALFIAAVIHAFILLSINFTIPTPPTVNKQIEITLSSTPAKKAPKKASFLAQDHQIGGGKKSQKPTPPKQKLTSEGRSNNKPPSPMRDHVPSKPRAKHKLITQKKADYQIVATKKTAPISTVHRPKISVESLRQQIAQMGAKIRYQQPASEQTKIKFINAVSTHKYVAAQYVKDWEQKIEKVGNLNYPGVARKKGFSGTLTTDVGIYPNGSIYSIRITRSSGNKALDDAAKRIIRLSAPFATLPAELLQQLDVLIITRVWRFSDETGITTR